MLIAFILFIGALVYLKVPIAVAKALDSRANKIRSDLDEAESLLKEAQDLLSVYQKKKNDAADEAALLLASAEEEAARAVALGEERLRESLKRREKTALDRIAQAEGQALDELKARTVSIALEATRTLLTENLTSEKAGAILDEDIKKLPKRLN